jgi:nucleoside phosphorylase
MIRLLYHPPGESPEEHVPEILRGDLVERVVASYDVTLMWSEPEQLMPPLEAEVYKLQGERRQFATENEGLRYFRSLGRRVNWYVFVSNAGPENDFAQTLCRQLDLNNIRFFHYVFQSHIRGGVPWMEALRQQLEATEIFVLLITPSYLESDTCMKEWEIAHELAQQGRLRIFAYILAEIPKARDHKLTEQARPLIGLSPAEQVKTIVKEIDEYMTPREQEAQPASLEAPSSDWRHWTEGDPLIDVAFVTVLPEEYAAVLRLLARVQPVPAAPGRPNRYQWVFGEVHPVGPGGTPYRVVLGLAGGPGTLVGLNITRDTIEVFRPNYVVLVGVAGGIGHAEKGDVVVADRIYGYEFGRAGDEFLPRPHWTYPTDTAVVAAAQAMPSRHPDWPADRIRGRPSDTWRPRIHVGPVASGNKVVETLSAESFRPVLDMWPDMLAVEMEGLGAAEAIRDHREKQGVVNFAMVRGISDVPLTGPLGTRAALARQWQRRQRGKLLASDAAAVLAIEMVRRAWSQHPRAGVAPGKVGQPPRP